MSWDPLLTPIAALKLQLKCAPTREIAKQLFDDFVATNPSDADLELAGTYYGWALYDFDVERVTKAVASS